MNNFYQSQRRVARLPSGLFSLAQQKIKLCEREYNLTLGEGVCMRSQYVAGQSMDLGLLDYDAQFIPRLSLFVYICEMTEYSSAAERSKSLN